MAWRQFINRSLEHLREETAKVMRASPLDSSLNTTSLKMASLRSSDDVQNWVIGCDSDIGGFSIANLDTYPSGSPDEGKGRFYGTLSSKVKPGLKLGGNKIDRSGYAGIRTKARPSLFGQQFWDTSRYTFLKVRVKPGLDEGMRYFINIQTDGPVQSDLFQHRLWLGDPGKWQDVLVPFRDFTLTNSGSMAETQIEMYREKVRTVGISILGPGEGPFELGIESIESINVESQDAESLLASGRKRELAEPSIAYVMSKDKNSTKGRRYTRFLTAILAMHWARAAAFESTQSNPDNAQKFIVYQPDVTLYPYTIHLPDRTTRSLSPLTTPPPVLLSLSGSGARGPASQAAVLSGYDGASRKIQEYNGGARTPAHLTAAEEFLTITPICPNNSPQSDANWDASKFFKILYDVSQMYEVDLTRVYLSAYSMGARASWDLLMSNPNIFAGAVLASGATYVGPADLSKLVGIPIRNYIGSQDDVGLSQSANLTYASYSKALSSVQSSLPSQIVASTLQMLTVPGANHLTMTNRPWDSDVIFDGYPGALSWLLAQHRPQGAAIPGVDLASYPSFTVNAANASRSASNSTNTTATAPQFTAAAKAAGVLDSGTSHHSSVLINVLHDQLSGYDGTSRRVREYYEGNVSLSHRQAAEEIYLTSYSMGCWATYDLLMKNPTLFAGVICSSGATGASQAELSKLLGIPLRVYYGEKDAESMVTQIKATQQRYDAALAAAKAGGNVTFNTSNILETILIPGATHLDMTDDPWDESTVTDGYAGALSWLLTQQRASNRVLLIGLASADFPILYSQKSTAADLDRAERYYLTLFNAPGAIPALLHAMIGVGLLSLCTKFARWEETNLFFDGSSIALMIAAVGMYASVSIPNLRILARQPIQQQQNTLGGRLRAFLSQPMATPEEAAEVPEPLSDIMRFETTSLLCAANNLIIAALVGVLMFQAAQAYAHRQYLKEMAKMNSVKKTQ
ncbi:hypothetical protein EMMF5_003080 [Cystobasidiomycetes sp. EMM_F5]